MTLFLMLATMRVEADSYEEAQEIVRLRLLQCSGMPEPWDDVDGAVTAVAVTGQPIVKGGAQPADAVVCDESGSGR